MSVRLVCLSTMLLFVAACNKNPFEVVVSRCLGVAVIGDLGTLVKFEGEGQTNNDIAFKASIMDLRSACEEGEDVKSQVSFSIGAQAGPALRGTEVTVPYFVAVVKDNSQIISKSSYDVTLRFNSEGIAVSEEVLLQQIPTIAQARRYNYEFLVGFQMDVDDIVFNMMR
ncbi:MAG: hypothetical protein KUG56_07070 [Kordiimonadaceae bacterium]|nr:hypothetical protein [Kordiimonadaceae bacterium]